MGLFNMSQDAPVRVSPDLQMPQYAMPQMPQFDIAKAKPKHNWIGILGDALAGVNGKEGMYAKQLYEQKQQDQMMARMQQQQAAEYARQVALYDYQQQHKGPPEPTDFERLMISRGIAQGSPQWNAHLDSYLNMKENPPYFTTDPRTGAPIMVPRNGMGMGAPAPQGVTFTPLDDGGPTAPQSGGFPGSY